MQRTKPIFDLLLRQSARNFLRQQIDDVCGCAGWRVEPVPGSNLEINQTGFLEGRNVDTGQSVGSGGCQRTQ